jgi:hypothetical protein
VRRRLKTVVLLLVVASKLIGGFLAGISTAAASHEAPEHPCPAMMAEHSTLAQAPDHRSSPAHHPMGDPAPASHTTHEKDCSSGCQCGCAHAPGSLFVPASSTPALSHPLEAHTVVLLPVQIRPYLVFKPPI